MNSSGFSNIQEFSCVAGSCSYPAKEIKKGNVTIINAEEAKKQRNDLDKNKPDCSGWGYAQAIAKQAKAESAGFKSPLATPGSPTVLSKTLPGGFAFARANNIGHLITAQKAIQGGIKGHEVHERRCNMYDAHRDMISEAAITKVAEIKYKQQATHGVTPSNKSQNRPLPEPKKPPIQLGKENPNPNRVQEITGRLEQKILSQSQTNPTQKIIVETTKQQPTSLPNSLPAPKVSLEFDLIHPKKGVVSFENTLSETVSTGVNIIPLKPTASTIRTTIALTDHVATSLVLNPIKPQHSSINLSYSQSDFSVGISIPTGKLKKGTVQMGGSIPDLGRVNASIPLSKPLRTEIYAEAPIPGTPFVAGVKVKLGQPQNARVQLGIQTYGLDKIVPGIPDKIKILSINCKKIRHKIKKCFGYKKKDRFSKKELKQHVEEHQVLMAKFHERESKMKQAIEEQIKKMIMDAINDVEAHYHLILKQEMDDLAQSLNEFFNEFSLVPTYRASVGDLNEWAWNETVWQNFFQTRGELIDSFDQLIRFTEQLDHTFEEVACSMENCLQASRALNEQYRTVDRTFNETERTALALAARQEQVRAYLQANVPQEIVQQLRDQFVPNHP